MKQKNVILMVVAVGCGLVAAFLTSQMSAKGGGDQVEVIVAAKDLPVGTMLTREEVDKLVKTKKVPKDGLPPAYVTTKDELIDKRLSRGVRAEETFNPQDLSKGGVITLPEGMDMVSLQVGVAQAVAGFVGPGSRVNVLATVRLGSKLHAFPLLVNMLVVAVDTHVAYDKNGVFPSMNTVSFAVKEKEALLLALAKQRGCNLELMLRHPQKSDTADKNYNIDEVIKLLSDERNQAKIFGGDGADDTEGNKKDPASPTVKPPVGPGTPGTPGGDPGSAVAPPPNAKPELIQILVAKHDIAPNTDVTADLIKEAFETKELPKNFAWDAYTDLTPALGRALKTGVAKGQWVTPAMVGLQSSKVGPQDTWSPPKPDPTQPNLNSKPPTPPVVKKKTIDVTIHTAHATKVVRYEEVEPGKWKQIAELTPEQAAKDGDKAPKGTAEEKKVD